MSLSYIREHVLPFLHAVRSCQSKTVASVTFKQQQKYFLLVCKESLDVMFKEKIECSEILYIYELFERHIFLIIKWGYS